VLVLEAICDFWWQKPRNWLYQKSTQFAGATVFFASAWSMAVVLKKIKEI